MLCRDQQTTEVLTVSLDAVLYTVGYWITSVLSFPKIQSRSTELLICKSNTRCIKYSSTVYIFWGGVHGCEPGRVSDGSRPALCQTLSIECRSFIVYLSLTCVFCYFVIHVPFSLSFVCLCFSLLSLELGRCSSDLFLSSRPRTGLATTCIIGYG